MLKRCPMSFGEFLQKKRKERGITQEAIENKLNVSKGTVSKYEHDKQVPDRALIGMYREILQVSRDEFYTVYELNEHPDVNVAEKIGQLVLQSLSYDELAAVMELKKISRDSLRNRNMTEMLEDIGGNKDD